MRYKTVRAQANAEYEEKRSRFISYIKPIKTPDEAVQFVKEIKSANYDAKHAVFAYVLKSGEERYSDDGEPQGTAGVPTLDVIRKSGICDAVIVTVRYFGGILLGGGGLVRAYSAAASDAIKKSGILVMERCSEMCVCIDYNRYTPLLRLINAKSGKVVSTQYGEKIDLKFTVTEDIADDIITEISEMTNGVVLANETGKIFLPSEE